MCGRYSLALRPGQVRQMLQDDNMPVDDAPADDDDDDAPRQSYNFAPGYHGIVYRADVPDWGAGPRKPETGKGAGEDDVQDKLDKSSDGAQDKTSDGAQKHSGDGARDGLDNAAPSAASSSDDEQQQQQLSRDENQSRIRYKLQSMRWGLVPFWTKRNPDYGSMLKTINCRDDSLAQDGGMWNTMKARKRCVVVAQGFYEWLKKDGGGGGGGRGGKVPHFVKRKDGALMCMAGLWDCVRYENEGADAKKHYTYTIITTDSNRQLRFLHDRMPAILDNGSAALRAWLDPGRHAWSGELQALLRPYEGELEVYPVSGDVGKVGNDSPTFIVPVDSRENKANIANFFEKQAKKERQPDEVGVKQEQEDEVGAVEGDPSTTTTTSPEEAKRSQGGTRDVHQGVKREAEDDDGGLEGEEPPRKMATAAAVSGKKVQSPSPQKGRVNKISATRNGTREKEAAAPKAKAPGTQKITKFFGNSA